MAYSPLVSSLPAISPRVGNNETVSRRLFDNVRPPFSTSTVNIPVKTLPLVAFGVFPSIHHDFVQFSISIMDLATHFQKHSPDNHRITSSRH